MKSCLFFYHKYLIRIDKDMKKMTDKHSFMLNDNRYPLWYEEQWRTIDGYEDYEVSDYGRVRNKNGRILSPYIVNGYLKVGMMKNGINKKERVHRLVALMWVDNPVPKYYGEINHINEDKTDNRAVNLEWCDRKYNCNYGRRNTKIRRTKIARGIIKA